MNSFEKLVKGFILRRFIRKKSSPPKSPPKKSYRTTPLKQDEFEKMFDPSFFVIDIDGIGNISIKSKSESNEDNEDCLMLRQRREMIHIRKLDKCREGGKNLLKKLIDLSEKYQKKLIIDVDISQISFNFGEKDFKEQGTVKLYFNYGLVDLYLQCYGMTWYNSLGFVDENFDSNHAFFVKKYGKYFEENKKDQRDIRRILNKGKDMTYEEYEILKKLEDKYNLSSKSNGDEFDKKYYDITHKLIYDPSRVYQKAGRRTKRKRVRMI
jgi:hypothetical protein